MNKTATHCLALFPLLFVLFVNAQVSLVADLNAVANMPASYSGTYMWGDLPHAVLSDGKIAMAVNWCLPGKGGLILTDGTAAGTRYAYPGYQFSQVFCYGDSLYGLGYKILYNNYVSDTLTLIRLLPNGDAQSLFRFRQGDQPYQAPERGIHALLMYNEHNTQVWQFGPTDSLPMLRQTLYGELPRFYTLLNDQTAVFVGKKADSAYFHHISGDTVSPFWQCKLTASSSNLEQLSVVANGKLYFVTPTATAPQWMVTDGTASGTLEICPSSASATSFELDGKVYLINGYGELGYEDKGVFIRVNAPAPSPAGEPVVSWYGLWPATNNSGSVLMTYYTKEEGIEPCLFNGTTYTPLPPICPGPKNGCFSWYFNKFKPIYRNGYTYFMGQDPEYGAELWRVHHQTGVCERMSDATFHALGTDFKAFIQQDSQFLAISLDHGRVLLNKIGTEPEQPQPVYTEGQWARTLFVSNGTVDQTGLVADNDGGAFAIGNYYTGQYLHVAGGGACTRLSPPETAYTDYTSTSYVVHFDSAGNVLWYKTFTLDWVDERAALLPNGDLIFLGWRWGIGMSIKRLKGETGEIIWEQFMATEGVRGIVANDLSAYLLIENTRLMCLDVQTGNFRWSRPLNDFWVERMTVLPEGGMLIGGDMAVTGTTGKNKTIRRLDAEGNALWSRSFRSTKEGSVQGLVSLRNEETLTLLTFSDTIYSGGTLFTASGSGSEDRLWARLNARNGEILSLWQDTAYSNKSPKYLVETADRAGAWLSEEWLRDPEKRTYYSNIWNTREFGFPVRGNSCRISQRNKNGQPILTHTYQYDYYNCPRLATSPDGHLFVSTSGARLDTLPDAYLGSWNNSYGYLYRLSPSRFSLEAQSLSPPLLPSDLAPGGNAADLHLTVFPNPASGSITFYSADKTFSGSQLTWIDATGRTVLTQALDARLHENTLDVSQLGAGIYIVKVNNGTETRTIRLTVN